MKYLNFILLFFIVLSGKAQNEFIRINIAKQKSMNYEDFYKKHIKITPIRESEFKYHFSFYIQGKSIDIFSNDGINFTGKIVERSTEKKLKRKIYREQLIPLNYVYMISDLKHTEANTIGQYILENKIYSIPTDTNIKYWDFNWEDCRSSSIYMKVDSQFFSGSYDCLKHQEDSIEYVPQLKQFNQFIKNSINLYDYHSIMLDHFKHNRRYSDGYIVTTVWSKSRTKKFHKNKEKLEYLDTMLDSIDLYIGSELTRLIEDKDVKSDASDYQIIISSKRRLKRIQVRMPFWERFANLEYIKWKWKIRKAFKHIDLTFIQPELSIKFKRNLSVGGQNIELYSPIFEHYW